MSYTNFPKFVSSTCNFKVTLKPGLGVTQVHRNRHISIRHLWLPINVHSNHKSIWYHFRDKRWFQSKITIFPHPGVFCAPVDRIPLWVGHRRTESKNKNDGATRWSKSFKIGLAVWTQYRRVTDRRTDRYRTTAKTVAMHSVARVISFSIPVNPPVYCRIFFHIGNSLCVVKVIICRLPVVLRRGMTEFWQSRTRCLQCTAETDRTNHRTVHI